MGETVFVDYRWGLVTCFRDWICDEVTEAASGCLMSKLFRDRLWPPRGRAHRAFWLRNNTKKQISWWENIFRLILHTSEQTSGVETYKGFSEIGIHIEEANFIINGWIWSVCDVQYIPRVIFSFFFFDFIEPIFPKPATSTPGSLKNQTKRCWHVLRCRFNT